MDLLATKPEKITTKLLSQYSDFWDVRLSDQKKKGGSVELSDEDAETPEETIDRNYQEIKSVLRQELLLKLQTVSWQSFERLVLKVLEKMRYGGLNGEISHTKLSGDEGIDGIIKEDALGLEYIYVQAKRYKQGSNVGRPEIQGFVGALAGKKARKGIFITTSDFHINSINYAKSIEQKVVLINGHQLVDYMIDLGIGVSVKETYEIKRIDNDYFEEL